MLQLLCCCPSSPTPGVPQPPPAQPLPAHPLPARRLFSLCRYAIDGCATFFKRDRFALVKKYEVGTCGMRTGTMCRKTVHSQSNWGCGLESVALVKKYEARRRWSRSTRRRGAEPDLPLA